MQLTLIPNEYSPPAATYHPVAELPPSERPAERLRQVGAGALSSAELLDLLVGTSELDIGRALLARFESLRGVSRADVIELTSVPGIGEARAARIKAAFELSQRLSTEPIEERPTVKAPADAANLLADMCALEQEHMRVLLLDTRNRVLAIKTVYVGNLNSAVVRVGELFRDAVRYNCAAIIVAHNHPSSDPTPSPEDVRVTGEIFKAGKLLDIQLLDHLVIGGPQRFVSLKERGLGFA